MKTILTIILVLLASTSFAFTSATKAVVSSGAAAAAIKYCVADSCTPTNTTKCEGFGAAATNCTWSAGVQADTSITATLIGVSIPSGLGCTDTGGYAARIVKASGDYGIWESLSSYTAADNVYVQFYINISAISLGDGEETELFQAWENGYHSPGISLWVHRTGASYYFIQKAYGAFDYTTTPTVSTGTWYGIRMNYIKNTSVDLAIDWNNDGTFTAEQTPAVINDSTFDRAVIRTVTTATAQTFTFYIANLKVSTVAYPLDCTR